MPSTHPDPEGKPTQIPLLHQPLLDCRNLFLSHFLTFFFPLPSTFPFFPFVKSALSGTAYITRGSVLHTGGSLLEPTGAISELLTAATPVVLHYQNLAT